MRNPVPVVVLAVELLAGCAGGDADGVVTYELPEADAERYDTAYVAAVVANPPGDDLAGNAGEHVVIATNATIRVDLGGWWLETEGDRLPLGIGRQIDVDAELRVHSGHGSSDEDDVFAGLDQEVLDDAGGLIVLRDAAGKEVARFEYGD